MRFLYMVFALIEIIYGFACGADIYLDVTKKRKSIIALSETELSGIVRNDLKLSGFFIPVKNDKIDLVAQPLSYWFSQGADFFLNLETIRKGDIITLNARLYETGTGRNRLAKSYKGETSAERLLAHSLSDDIVSEITGHKGIAATHIAFVRDKGSGKEIYIMDYDGASLRQLTHHGSISIDPAWSPDKEKIAYMSYKDGNPNLFLIEWRGGETKPISSLAGLNAHPSWRNNHELALTLSIDGNPEIYHLNIIKNVKERLTWNKRIDSSPCWSPDGRRIAFTSDRSGYPKIYVMSKNGLDPGCLTLEFTYADSPTWAPSGEFIAFTGRLGGNFNIFIVRPDGADLRQVTSGAGDNEAPSWAPDSRHIAFSSNRSGRKEVFIIDIYGEDEANVFSGKGDSFSPSWSP